MSIEITGPNGEKANIKGKQLKEALHNMVEHVGNPEEGIKKIDMNPHRPPKK